MTRGRGIILHLCASRGMNAIGRMSQMRRDAGPLFEVGIVENNLS